MKDLRKKPSLDFSLVGGIYIVMTLFMCVAAINSQANLLFAVFGLMVGVLLVSWYVSRTVLRKVVVNRNLPDSIVVGQPATFQYEFANRKRFWPTLSITLGELSGADAFAVQPQAYLLHAAAATRAIVPMQVLPKRRGLHQLDSYQLSTSFPFGFVKRALQRRQKDSILIYPPLARVDRKLLSLFTSAELAGARMKPRRGGSDEFYGVKDFRQGENPRWIYWRRSARTGTLVAKEMTRVSPPRLMILVDTHLQERTPADHALVERTIAIAASLVTRTLEEGFAVGLAVWSGSWIVVSASRGKRHSRDLMAILARLELNTAAPIQDLVEHGRQHLRSGTTVILVTPREIPQSLTEQARARSVVISAASEQAKRWFRFESEIDFAHAMPPDQEPLQQLGSARQRKQTITRNDDPLTPYP